MDAAVRWRAGSKERSRGRYWWLETGRGATRRTIALGFVTELEARTAVATMNRDEDRTRSTTTQRDRLYRKHQEDPAKVLRYLLAADGAHDPFGPEPADYGAMTLQAYFDGEYKGPRAARRPRTWVTEAGHWRRILAELGDTRLRDLNPHVVADYLDELRVERGGGDRPASGATKRLHRAALQALLKYAHRKRHVPAHVDLSVFTIEGSTRRVRAKRAPLTLEELVRLMNASSPKHRAMWAVGAGEGLRPSELRRLRWEDVRWPTRTLLIRGDDEGQGKTELSVAEIPLTPLAHRELQAWWIRRGQPTEGVMFHAEARRARAPGDQPYESGTAYRRALASAAKAAKLGRVNMYLLRDSFATIAWSIGIDMDVARRILRHADETMLREVYCRPRPADLVERVAAFDVPS